CKAIINQKDSVGAGSHGLIAGPVENLACAAAWHWEEFTFAAELLTAAINYILNIIGNGTQTEKGESYKITYDENGAVDSYTVAGGNYLAPASPWVLAAEVATRDYSIYANYTGVPWTGEISGVVNPAKIAGVVVANITSVKGV
ncbi:unnamed protein product, partial [marine sediment metagenome]